LVGLLLVEDVCRSLSDLHALLGRTSYMSVMAAFAMSFQPGSQLAIYWLLVMMSHALNYYNSFARGSCNQHSSEQLVQSHWKP